MYLEGGPEASLYFSAHGSSWIRAGFMKPVLMKALLGLVPVPFRISSDNKEDKMTGLFHLLIAELDMGKPPFEASEGGLFENLSELQFRKEWRAVRRGCAPKPLRTVRPYPSC